MTRRTFVAAAVAGIGAEFAPEWKTERDAVTGRTLRRLTSAPANSYPLYYFIPSITADDRYLVFHSERDGWVQLYRMDLESGRIVQLTAATTRESGWAIWCEPHLRGVYNHLSALNQATGEVAYFQDEEIRAVRLDTLAGRVLHRMPGRTPIGQTGFSPDGRLFAFIHADAAHFRRAISDREALGNMGRFSWPKDHQNWRNSVPTTISVLDTAGGGCRDVVRLDYHVHHVMFADNQRLLVNHPKNDPGMWTIRTDGTDRRHLRPRDAHGVVVHQVVTAAGIFYEAVGGPPGSRNRLGCYDLARQTWEEVPLPDLDGYVHTGWDPAGRFLFFEHHGNTHQLISLHFPFRKERTRTQVLRTMPPYPRPGQRYHAHPFLSPGRKWLFYTEVVDGFSQVCALDVADLVDREEYWTARG